MSFTSIAFIIFFIIFATLYFLIPKQSYSQILILISSVIFYSFADIRFLPILFYVCLVSYFFGILKKQKAIFILFVILDLLPLLFFKYTNFLLSSIFLLDKRLNLFLPLGVSFFTFQGLSYVIDCYTEKYIPEKNPIIVFSYICFFPVISSGPIQRPEKLIPQLKEPHQFDYKNATDGMKLFLWGMFKKLCIADKLALYVNSVYSSMEHSGCAFLLATFFYAFQLYIDFSGYSDMAIGIGKFLGFDLDENFNHPYLSKSVGEFWRRWHISLSSWLKDYVYIPLGGSRCALLRICINLLITFLVSGIWHGAAWTFIVWGLIHGIYQCVGRLTKNSSINENCPDWIKIIITFILISLAWIFFRANSIQESFVIVKKIFCIPKELIRFPNQLRSLGLKESVRLLFAFGAEVSGLTGIIKSSMLLISFIIIEIFTYKKNGLEIINSLPTIPRWILYIGFILFFLIIMPVNTDTQFVYFNF